MAYAAYTDVQGINGTTYDTDTIPTSTQVTSFTEQVSAEIDALFSTFGVSTPVTANDYLKQMVMLKSAALAEAGFKRNNMGTDDADWRLTEYTRMWEELKANPLLAGISISNSGAYSRNDNTSGYTGRGDYSFEKSERDW